MVEEQPTNRIKELRKQRKMTQLELAEKIGTTQVHLGRLENGKASFDVEWMLTIAKVFGVRAYELLPQSEQPEEVTPEEREMLRMVRKMAEPKNHNNDHLQPQNASCETIPTSPTLPPKPREL